MSVKCEGVLANIYVFRDCFGTTKEFSSNFIISFESNWKLVVKEKDCFAWEVKIRGRCGIKIRCLKNCGTGSN